MGVMEFSVFQAFLFFSKRVFNKKWSEHIRG